MECHLTHNASFYNGRSTINRNLNFTNLQKVINHKNRMSKLIQNSSGNTALISLKSVFEKVKSLARKVKITENRITNFCGFLSALGKNHSNEATIYT